jgi:putative flippase GtrA
MALIAGDLYARVRHLIPEMLKFGAVGGIGAVFDLGGAAVLHGMYGESALEAKGISTIVAGVVTYLLSRFWTFKDRDSQELKRQAAYFVGLNVIALIMAEAVVALVTGVAGLHGQVMFNLASFFGTGLGTIFRYVTYRKWVFTADDDDAAALAAAAPQRFPDYPPWELDPGFLEAQQASPSALARVPAGTPAPVYPAASEAQQAVYRNSELAPAANAARERALTPALSAPWKPALEPAMSGRAPSRGAMGGNSPAPQAPAWGRSVSAPQSAPTPALPRRSGGGRHRKH